MFCTGFIKIQKSARRRWYRGPWTLLRRWWKNMATLGQVAYGEPSRRAGSVSSTGSSGGETGPLLQRALRAQGGVWRAGGLRWAARRGTTFSTSVELPTHVRRVPPQARTAGLRGLCIPPLPPAPTTLGHLVLFGGKLPSPGLRAVLGEVGPAACASFREREGRVIKKISWITSNTLYFGSTPLQICSRSLCWYFYLPRLAHGPNREGRAPPP